MSLIERPSTTSSKPKQQPTRGSSLNGVAVAGACVDGSPLESSTLRIFKRAADLILAVALGIFLLPLIVLIAVVIKCVSRGPVFFSQERLGHDGKPFRMWKFRTMVADAERRLDDYLDDPLLYREWITSFRLKDDPRIIPVIGPLLRKSSLDELPQLWNVLLGEMSFVGPRPLPVYHLEQFDDEFRELRAAVLPGITGQWQVCSRDHSAAEMFQKWDTYYVRNWSIWLDVQILFRTPWAVFSGKGAG